MIKVILDNGREVKYNSHFYYTEDGKLFVNPLCNPEWNTSVFTKGKWLAVFNSNK